METNNLWADFYKPLRNFVARRVTNDADVEDVLQEVFLRIHKHLHTLQQAERVDAWMYQITRNVITDHYRAREALRAVVSGNNGVEIESALLRHAASLTDEDEDNLRQMAECLRPMIERLADPYRQALTLTELEGVTQTAAAAYFGISVSGMKSRVQRGRERLKQQLLTCCKIELDRRGGIADYECSLCDDEADDGRAQPPCLTEPSVQGKA